MQTEKIHRGLEIRLYPNKEQKEQLSKLFEACRFVYNQLLDYKKTSWDNDKISINFKELSRYNRQDLKSNNPWLTEKLYNTKVIQETVRNTDTAFKNFFKYKKGYPKFKSYRDVQSVTFPREAVSVNTFDQTKDLLNLTKIVKGIKFRDSKNYKDFLYTNKKSIKSITIKKTKTNEYYASILVETDILPRTYESSTNQIGIDLGIKEFVTFSDGSTVPNPKWIRSNEKKLKKLQRQLSKKVKGSKNKEKARLRLAKKHNKIKNQKQDFLHNLTTNIISENQVIVLEDLNVSGMMKSHRLAKAIQEIGMYGFRRQLEYKTKWYGRDLVFVDRFFPSSKKCSNCGNVKSKDEFDLSVRVYTCECGHKQDRDLNASLNILQEGLRILNRQVVGEHLPEFTLVDSPLTGQVKSLDSYGWMKQEILINPEDLKS